MSKHNRISEAKVGLIVFLGILLFAFSVFLIGGERGILRPQYNLFVTFPNIYGLDIGAAVRLAGLDVGRVKNIYFAEDLAKTYVLVELELDKRMQERVREDSVASIQTMGLLGDKYIAISVGSNEFQILQSSGYLISETPGDIAQFLDKGGQVLENMVNITDSLSRVLEKQGLEHFLTNLDKMISSGSSILDQVQTGPGTLHDVIYKSKGSDVDKIMSNLASSSQNLSAVMKKINQGDGTLGAFINDRSAYDDLKAILGGARRSKLFQYMVRYSVKKIEGDD
jgi:phospholipid/cholesterol/gamma-HCH transport system substrate-binding protein